jgi:hypothetical protein
MDNIRLARNHRPLAAIQAKDHLRRGFPAVSRSAP